MTLYFVTELKTGAISSSWEAFNPIVCTGTAPVKNKTGKCSRIAFAAPVTRFVPPGPLQPILTLIRPEYLA
ncbi:hypothetical protein J2T14_002396 [Paenibacillus harenae]|nr:hypothetical protein [Paenibacillus harenae]